MSEEKSLFLASQSTRRRELINLLGFPFYSLVADVDEALLPDETPTDYVRRLAEAKARACCPDPSLPLAQHPRTGAKGEGSGSFPLRGRAERGGKVVIGSDTAVVDAGEILGKPEDAREAESMLRQLRGRTHQVYTGIAVYELESERVFRDLCVSEVPMRCYEDEEMLGYIQSGDPFDKAGGYAIQHEHFSPVENFKGCFASVMGLPLCHLARNLKKAGMPVDVDLPAVCKASLSYDCVISDAVLRGENLG